MRFTFEETLTSLTRDRFLATRVARLLSGMVITASLCGAMTALNLSSNSSGSHPSSGIDVTAASRSVSAVPSALSGTLAAEPQRIPGELIVIKRTGIEPTSITRSTGRFLLLVYNRSGLSEVALTLGPVGGPLLRQVIVPSQKLDWRSVEELSPGDYLLSEANHPGWTCRITITP